MAIEEKVILSAEVGGATTSIKELRTELKEARTAMGEATIGSDEFKAASERVTAAQNALTNATKLGVTEAKAAGDSYNALSRQMAELKQQYHATTDEMKRQELASEISVINDRLKAMDANVGVFNRNVGNYADGVAKGFSAMGGAAGAMINPIQGVTTGFQVLSKTPVIAIIGIIINLLSKAYTAMKSSEEGSQALAKAFDAFKIVGDLLTKGLQLLGKAFVWVGDGITTLFKKFGLLKEQSEERVEIGQKEIELAKEQRRVTMENADAELAISKLRAQATDKINLSASKRLELLKEAGELEKKVSENNYNLAKKEYELIKAKNELLPSSSQEMQEQADAYAAMVNAETAYFNKQREYNSQMAEAFNQAKTQAKDLKIEIGGMIELFPNAQSELAKSQEEARTKFLQDQAVFEEEALGFEEDFSKDLEKIAKGRADDEKKLSDREKKWQEEKFDFLSSNMRAFSKVVGEETAVGKGLAVASALIDTYKGAATAISVAQELGPLMGPIVGGINAASVIATGLANIKSIMAVKTDGKTTSMPSTGVAMHTAAPAVIQQVPVMRSLTSASEEDRLNGILDNTGQTASGVNQPVKAYVVQTELEGEQLYADTQRSESSF